MAEILLGLITLFVALNWYENSRWILDQRRKMPKRKANVRRRWKNWNRRRRGRRAR